MDEDIKKVLDELREIKALLRQDIELDKRDLDLDTSEMSMELNIEEKENIIEEETKKIDENTKGFAENLTGLKYVSLDAWHRTVWINCEARQSKEEAREIAYTCKLYGGPCKFEICPKNMGQIKK